jgi:Flp pilus assembly protein TadD
MALILKVRRGPSSGRRAALLVFLSLAAALGGCRSFDDITGSIGSTSSPAALPTTDDGLRAYTEKWGKRYDENPGEKVASINYARGLRGLSRYTQAVAVMQSAAVKAPKDLDVLAAYGKALADNGQLQQAADVLSHSYTPDRPNWASMSAQGSVADQLGDHAQAQEFYKNALKIAPNEPAVLSNLGLSYALTKQLPLAEETLRQAAAQPSADRRVRDNLALVLALEGKFAEAEKVGEQDMSPEDAAANVAAVRQMIAQSNSWREIQTLDAKKRDRPAQKPKTDSGGPGAPMQIQPAG